MQKGLHYTSEDTGCPLEIHVYTGADADFVLYEDAGDGYGYENGEYAMISMHWDDKTGSLTIDERTSCQHLQPLGRLGGIFHAIW